MSINETTESHPYRSGLGDILRDYFVKVRSGDVGSLPAVLGLVALVVVFSILRPGTFTGPLNFANLIGQGAGVIVLAMGLVFVLLLGEIDLSAGYTGGTAAAVMGVVMTRHGWPFVPSLIVCLLTGTLIGFTIGILVARLGVPSFVVTLAYFLGLQGVMLVVIGEGGTIPFRNDVALALSNKNMPVWLGWALLAVVLGGYAVVSWRNNSRRRAQGLVSQPLLLWAIKVGALTIASVAVVGYLSVERAVNPNITSITGVPIVLAIIVGLMVVLTFFLTRTPWGRHVYAVGGNAEAARRSGINVQMIKISCFMLCSTIAAFAGLLLASRTNSVSPNTGGDVTLLLAVGSAVIGGTSLFGGKGRASDAVIGGLALAVINNGMLLLNQPAGRVFIITGLVLLVAASVDAISRRQAVASGRA
jgi:D-xylose transport system permease protein